MVFASRVGVVCSVRAARILDQVCEDVPPVFYHGTGAD